MAADGTPAPAAEGLALLAGDILASVLGTLPLSAQTQSASVCHEWFVIVREKVLGTREVLNLRGKSFLTDALLATAVSHCHNIREVRRAVHKPHLKRCPRSLPRACHAWRSSTYGAARE